MPHNWQLLWCALAGIKEDAEEKLRQFLSDWQQTPQPLPDAANEQRMAIDMLHADLIHLQEEKNVFVFQVRSHTRSRISLQGYEMHEFAHLTYASECMASDMHGHIC